MKVIQYSKKHDVCHHAIVRVKNDTLTCANRRVWCDKPPKQMYGSLKEYYCGFIIGDYGISGRKQLSFALR